MRTFLLATTAFLVAVPAARAQRNETLQRIDTTFAFGKGGSVDLGQVSGEIVVTGWTRTDIRIYASIETGYLEASLSSSRVRIATHSRRNRMGKSRFELSVPIGTIVHASSVSGDIAIRGTAGEVSASTVSGDVEVRDAADRVELQSTSGDMRASRLRGRLRSSSVSGDVTLEDVNGDLYAHTVSGELRVRGTLTGLDFESVSGDVTFDGDIQGDGSYSANTHSGDVRLMLPSNVSATLELQTYSGEVRSAFPITLQPGEQPLNRRNRRMRFTVNAGGPRISLETFSGDIIIERGAARAPKEN